MKSSLAYMAFGYFLGFNLIYTADMAFTGQPFFGLFLFLVNSFSLISTIRGLIKYETFLRLMEARHQTLEALLEFRRLLAQMEDVMRLEQEQAKK